MSKPSPLLQSFSRAITITTLLALSIAATAVVFSIASSSASAQTEEETQALRDKWQDEYRQLLSDRARLKSNITKSRKNYAQAQRRNYPRGGARQQFMVDAELAEKQLEATEEAIEQLYVDARRAGVRPGWLSEVEDEPIRRAEPAAPDATRADEDDRAGRNPLYADDDDSDEDS